MQPTFKEWGVMLLPLHVQYLYKLLGFFSAWEICVFSPFNIYFHHLFQYELMDVYFILCGLS